MTRYSAILAAGLVIAAASLPHGEPHAAQDAARAGQRLEECRARLSGSPSDETVRAAITELQEVRALFRLAADSRGEVAALDLVAGAYHHLGDVQESIDALWAKLAGVREAGDRQAEADTLSYMGYIARDLGDFQTMLDANEQALAIYRGLGTPENLIQGLMGLAIAYKALNEPERSARTYEEADAVSRSPTRPSISLSTAGQQYERAGLKTLALERYEQAAQLSRNAGRSAEECQLVLHAARLGAGLGQRERAQDYVNRALAYWASRQQEPNVATLILLGRAAGPLGDRALAVRYLGRAYAAAPTGVPAAADWYRDIGEAYRDVGEKSKAARCFRNAAASVRLLHNHLREARLLAFAAEMERDLGELDAAREHIEAALPMFEAVRGTIASPGIRSAYFSTIQRHYDLHIDVLMRLHEAKPSEGHAAAALRASEHARGRGLLDLLTEAGVDLRTGVDAALLQRERAAKRELDGLADRRQTALAQARTSPRLEELNDDIKRAAAEYERVQGQIRAASPAYAALARPVPLTVEEIQRQVLDADTLLLEYALGTERSYLWVVSRDSLASFRLAPRDDIEALARRVYDLLTARNQHPAGETTTRREARIAAARAAYPQAASRLSAAALGPAASLLGQKRLVIVAQGALQYIPFAALPDPSATTGAASPSGAAEPPPLVVGHEVVYLPSASVLAALREGVARRPRAPLALAVLADPVFDKDDPRVTEARRAASAAVRPSAEGRPGRAADRVIPAARAALVRSLADVGLAPDGRIPRLPFSRQEAAAIAGGVPADQRMEAVDFRAAKDTATRPELGQYRLVHFATHGVIDSENPALSGLVLSLVDERGDPREGFLQLSDIYNLTLPADLIVLSACQTALGRDVRGEGLVGLVRGFMYAGAARVAASLWRLDDAATADLMSRFYGNMLRRGLPPAAALRAVMTDVERPHRWRDPYYWAAFQLQGDWR